MLKKNILPFLPADLTPCPLVPSSFWPWRDWVTHCCSALCATGDLREPLLSPPLPSLPGWPACTCLSQFCCAFWRWGTRPSQPERQHTFSQRQNYVPWFICSSPIILTSFFCCFHHSWVSWCLMNHHHKHKQPSVHHCVYETTTLLFVWLYQITFSYYFNGHLFWLQVLPAWYLLLLFIILNNFLSSAVWLLSPTFFKQFLNGLQWTAPVKLHYQ